jgi:hypothetical protein
MATDAGRACLPVDYVALFDWNLAVPVQVRFVLGAS